MFSGKESEEDAYSIPSSRRRFLKLGPSRRAAKPTPVPTSLDAAQPDTEQQEEEFQKKLRSYSISSVGNFMLPEVEVVHETRNESDSTSQHKPFRKWLSNVVTTRTNQRKASSASTEKTALEISAEEFNNNELVTYLYTKMGAVTNSSPDPAPADQEDPTKGDSKNLKKKQTKALGARNSSSQSNRSVSSALLQDKGQARVIYYQFGWDAKSVLLVERDTIIPKPEAPDHVLLRVQASYFFWGGGWGGMK